MNGDPSNHGKRSFLPQLGVMLSPLLLVLLGGLLSTCGLKKVDQVDSEEPGEEGTVSPGTAVDPGPAPDPSSLAEKFDCEAESSLASVSGGEARQLAFVNNGQTTVKLSWLNYQGERVAYTSVKVGQIVWQSTFAGHPWLVSDEQDQCLFVAPNTSADGTWVCLGPKDDSCVNPSPDPFYAKVRDDKGLLFLASAKVSDAALSRAQWVAQTMLQNVPYIREAMVKIRFRVEIIAASEVLSDLPDFADLKGQKTTDGRDYDTGTRGVANVDKQSVGEENLLCSKGQHYPLEDIMVHEFAHSIKAHFDKITTEESEAAYANARAKNLYNASIYMMRNSQEYWAEATQSWFGKTMRVDVNDGYNTAAKLKEHDPDLAKVLSKVYGDPAPTVDKILPDCGY